MPPINARWASAVREGLSRRAFPLAAVARDSCAVRIWSCEALGERRFALACGKPGPGLPELRKLGEWIDYRLEYIGKPSRRYQPPLTDPGAGTSR